MSNNNSFPFALTDGSIGLSIEARSAFLVLDESFTEREKDREVDRQPVTSQQDFTGTSGDDSIDGTSANDRIWGLEGNDSISGGFGDDYLYGEAGNDTLDGGFGDDALHPGTGIDSISGGDQFYADFLYLDFESETTDLTVNYTASNNGTISNGTVFNGIEQLELRSGIGNDLIEVSAATFSGAFVPTFANFIYGGAGDDSIIGGTGNDRLDGEDGGDLLYGREGNDSLSGGFGDDYLYGETGNDTLDGSFGNDAFYPGTGIDSIIGWEGVDYLYLDLSAETANLTFTYNDPNNGTISNGTTLNEIEQISLTTGSGNDTIDVSAATFGGYYVFTIANFANAGAGNDSIIGGIANDALEGAAGNDTLVGGGGDDFLYPGTGVDSIIGETGIDHLFIDLATATTSLTVTYTNTANGSISNGTQFREIETINLRTGSGNDNINVSAASFSGYYDFDFYTTKIYSGAGNDKITTGGIVYGEAGNDTLNGGVGNDTLYGDIGKDKLLGNAGDDHLMGGIENDTLTGGTGADRFTFNVPSEGLDRITDFNITDDTIAVSASGFTEGLVAGTTIEPSQFYIGAAANGADQRFIYNHLTGALSFDLDGNGSQIAIQFARLSTNLAMTHTDILVVG